MKRWKDMRCAMTIRALTVRGSEVLGDLIATIGDDLSHKEVDTEIVSKEPPMIRLTLKGKRAYAMQHMKDDDLEIYSMAIMRGAMREAKMDSMNISFMDFETKRCD